MKYLKRYKTFELKDETYLSAADKLQRNHPNRAKSLRKWVDDKQTSDIDYIDPRPLNAMNNVYYITDIVLNTLVKGDEIRVTLESVNDVYTLVIWNWVDVDNIYNGLTSMLLNYGTPWGSPGYNKRIDDKTLGLPGNEFPDIFYFSDSKYAKIFMDIVEKETGDKLKFTINDIYKS